jgi:hypothetical protein
MTAIDALHDELKWDDLREMVQEVCHPSAWFPRLRILTSCAETI